MLRELESFGRLRRSLFYPKADLPVPDRYLRGQHADPASLHSIARDACLRALGESPQLIHPLGESGTFHVLFRAILSQDRRVIIRLGPASPQGPDFPLYFDAWAAEQLRGCGLPALRVHHIDVSRNFAPCDVEILDEAPGRSLTFFDDDEERLRPLLQALGRFVGRMHGIRTQGFGFFDVRPLVQKESSAGVWGICSTWRNYLVRRLEVHVERCAALGVIDRQEARRIFAAFARAENLLSTVDPCLLHGDLGSHNVFVDQGDITALIDWEDCLSGDPVYELAFWATFHPERRYDAFLEGYCQEQRLPESFESRFWIYYLRVALAKTVLRARLGIADRPGREPAARRIQKGLERFEGVGKPSRLAA